MARKTPRKSRRKVYKLPEAYIVRGAKGSFVPVIEQDDVTTVGEKYRRPVSAVYALGRMLVQLSCQMNVKTNENA